MKKTDRRIQRTIQSLTDALIDSTLENGYAQLTVRDITQRADISYSTFFRHFKSIEELTVYVLRIGLENVMNRLTDDMSAQDEAFEAFSYISKNPRIYRLIAKVPRNHPGIEAIRNQMTNSIREVFVSRNDAVVPIELIAHHHATATMELFRWWIENDMKMSPQQMASIHYEMIVKSSRSAGLELRLLSLPGDEED